MPKKKVAPESEQEPIASESPPTATSPPAARARPRDMNLLTLNDQERGFTREDSEDIKWRYLNSACYRKEILTGVVSSIETLENRSKVAVVDYQGVRILIPAKEMFNIECADSENLPLQYQIRMNKILGATIDFILIAVDIRGKAAVASRKLALQADIHKFYDSGRVQEGILMACRVTNVSNNVITVDACGLETYIQGRDLSWKWLPDAADYFATGDLVVAKVLTVKKDENGEYSIHLSIKDASENPDLEAAKKLVPNSTYFGTVTGVKDGVIFVRLQAGVNAKTKMYRCELPQRKDTVCFLVRRVDTERAMALGLITRIIKKSDRLR